MSLSGQLLVAVRLQYGSARDLGSPKYPLSVSKAANLTSGTGANQASKVFDDTRTLAASTTEDLDLAGSLVDAFGATLTFTKIKGLVVAAHADNVNNVVVGGAASNGFINWVADATDKVVVRPGGVFALFAPDATAYAVTAATGDLLRIGNSGAGTSVVYDLVVVGV